MTVKKTNCGLGCLLVTIINHNKCFILSNTGDTYFRQKTSGIPSRKRSKGTLTNQGSNEFLWTRDFSFGFMVKKTSHPRSNDHRVNRLQIDAHNNVNMPH